MVLQLYNTLTRKEEEFKPHDPKNVRMYVCGPTVYDRPHLGNARSVVVYDVLYRVLMHLYPKVTYVRNITDVDDKINAAAKANGEPISALTARITKQFHEDMNALNVLKPDFEPTATGHIPQMVAMIETLIAKGNAYAAEGHVLFDVATDTDYGKLSRRSQKEMIAGARVEVAPYKKNPSDFVLWKPSKEDEPGWDSPWGRGRPGWHIECSAMSHAHLGTDFDIHGGGADLMFPHHENEIAQSCSAHPGSIYAKYWVHNGFLTVNGEKMSKSLGNFITVRELLDRGVNGEVIRYALLSTHYRKPLDFSEKLLEDAKKTLDRFYSLLEHHTEDESLSNFYIEPLLNDLNVSVFFSRLHSASNQFSTIPALRLLGFLQSSYEEWFNQKTALHSALDEEWIKLQISKRLAAKKAKNFAEADRIRAELAEQGIILEDKPDGTTGWRRA